MPGLRSIISYFHALSLLFTRKKAREKRN
jgi:hypothetical protein